MHRVGISKRDGKVEIRSFELSDAGVILTHLLIGSNIFPLSGVPPSRCHRERKSTIKRWQFLLCNGLLPYHQTPTFNGSHIPKRCEYP